MDLQKFLEDNELLQTVQDYAEKRGISIEETVCLILREGPTAIEQIRVDEEKKIQTLAAMMQRYPEISDYLTQEGLDKVRGATQKLPKKTSSMKKFLSD